MAFMKYGDPVQITSPKYFQCTCLHSVHLLRIEKEEDQIICSVFLNNYMGFFSRLLYAIKYVFGFKCKDGHFDSFIFKPEDIVTLKDFLNNSLQ